jgi:hypothetical protein
MELIYKFHLPSSYWCWEKIQIEIIYLVFNYKIYYYSNFFVTIRSSFY